MYTHKRISHPHPHFATGKKKELDLVLSHYGEGEVYEELDDKHKNTITGIYISISSIIMYNLVHTVPTYTLYMA